jgi:hypothetical protein
VERERTGGKSRDEESALAAMFQAEQDAGACHAPRSGDVCNYLPLMSDAVMGLIHSRQD